MRQTNLIRMPEHYKEITFSDIYYITSQNYIILDYLIEEGRPQDLEYTASALLNLLNDKTCKDQYMIPTIKFIGKIINIFERDFGTSIENTYKKIYDENILALINVVPQVKVLKEEIYIKGYNNYKTENINTILKLKNTFFNYVNTEVKTLTNPNQFIFKKLYDIRESIYLCLYKNEVLALYEKGELNKF